jgi:hypothetical protein
VWTLRDLANLPIERHRQPGPVDATGDSRHEVYGEENAQVKGGNEDVRSTPDLLAYCGFCRGDCLGHTSVVADAADPLLDTLETHKFHRTAECVFPDVLTEYSRFPEMLRFMSDLRCAVTCREKPQDEEPSGCAVKACCQANAFSACYECDNFKTCEVLASLHHELHADACAKNMRAIWETGLEAWLASGKRHTDWTEENE